MKRVSAILWLLILTILFACKEIRYREPQPAHRKDLSRIPPSLQGRFLISISNPDSLDTLKIMPHSFRFYSADPKEQETPEAGLSDSVVLRHFRGYYFINMREDDYWSLFVLQPARDGRTIFVYTPYVTDDPQCGAMVDSLIGADADTTWEAYRFLEPTHRELLNLLRSGCLQVDTLLRAR